MRRRTKIVTLAIFVFTVLCLLVVFWLARPANLVQPEQFERIQMGMARGEVEGILRVKADYFAYDGNCHLKWLKQEGPDMDAARMLSWHGDTHSICVWLDDDGRVACKAIATNEWTGTGIISQMKRKVGWRDNTK